MSSFRDQGWVARFGALGDEAEGIFEATYPEGWARFGLNRPPIRLSSVPPFIRYTPDYLTSKGLVEVQGLGRDQTFKLKVDKLAALHQWAEHFRVDLFVWDSSKRRYGWLRLDELDWALLNEGRTREFAEGKPYRALAAGKLPVVGGWTSYEAAA